jgi:hypothetical protein
VNKGSLKFKIIRTEDTDEVKVLLTASSNDWQGFLEFWCYANSIKDFAHKLKTFPGNLNEEVVFEIGEELSEKRPIHQCYLLLRVHCFDAVGHPAIEVVMNNNSTENDTKVVRFNIYSEPQQINDLGRMLSGWNPVTGSEIVWETETS